MQKRIVLTVAALWLVFSLAGCRLDNAAIESGDDERLKVVATIFAPYDFARAVAGDWADVTMLLPPASESHSYEPSAKDIIAIQNCDVFILVGGESDQWAARMLSSLDTDAFRMVTLMDCVAVVEEELVEGMQAETGHEAEHEAGHANERLQAEDEHGEGHTDEGAAYDEHVWTSPQNAKLIVQKISEALCAADAANAESYRQNTASYLTKLDALDAAFRTATAGAVRNTIVFGDRFPFRYLAEAYGLSYFAAFPGCAAQTEPSAETVAFLIDKVNAEKIPVVFHVELSNGKIAEAISAETGAAVCLLHACHTISRDDFEGGATYLELMQKNAEVLAQALQ